METGSARVLVAADGVGQESEVLATEDIGPESEEVAAEDVIDPLLSVDSDPLLSVAQDSQEPDEVIVLPDSQEVTADGVALDSQEPDEGIVLVPADGVALDSQELDEVVPESQMPPDSITPELLELAPESMEVVPESLPLGAFLCSRCHLVHEDREAWNRAHSRFYPCPRCGLVHADYFIDAMLGRINVDCELFMEHYKGLLPTKEYAKASVR